MANLFQANLSEDELAEIFAANPPRDLLPAAASGAWAEVARNPIVREWMVPLRERALDELDTPLPELTNELYHEFYRTGSRKRFDEVYFERRRRLSRAAICALLEPGESRWLDSVIRKTADILEEFSWGLPANINSLSGKDPMHIDAFSAGTGNIMGMLINFFGPALGEDLITKIMLRLRSQFFENYIFRHDDFFWMLSAGNWNAICHQGVVGTALTVEEDAAMLAKMLVLMKKFLPLFLSGFGNDGGCSEGPGYWQNGFGWFCILNEQLEGRTSGRLSLIEGDAKFSQIARFGPRVSLHNFYLANFSDSSQNGTLNPSLLSYLALRLNDEPLRQHAILHYRHLQQTELNIHSPHCDLLYLARLFLHCPAELPENPEVQYEDIFLKDLGVVVVHGQDEKGNIWDFAAKAGHNNEQHNHNDCGSYILNINGTPAIIEIGAPEYTKDYFRERRYEYLAARTLGHSLPIVNGCEQAAGVHYAAKVLNIEIEPDQVHFCVDITHCYPSSAGCGEVVRDFRWDKLRGHMQVKDYYELSKNDSFESSIITDKAVSLTEREASLPLDKGRVVIRPQLNTMLASVEDHEYRDPNGVTRKIHRIILKPQNVEEQRFISYEITVEE